MDVIPELISCNDKQMDILRSILLLEYYIYFFTPKGGASLRQIRFIQIFFDQKLHYLYMIKKIMYT